MITPRYWLILAGGLLLGLVAGAAWPPPPLPKTTAGAGDWSLPSTQSIARHVPQDMSAAATALHWNGESGGAMDSNWTLAGIVHDPVPTALLVVGGKTAEVIRVPLDGNMPDGSRLQAVDGDRITTKRDACLTIYQMFVAAPVNTSGSCGTPGANEDEGNNE